MRTDEEANSRIHNLIRVSMAFVLAGALVLAGCDSTDVTENPEIASIDISPDNVSIEVGEQVDFSAVALTASGDTVRDVDWEWVSTDPAVFTVEDTGTATGKTPGSAFCTVGVSDDAAPNAVHRKAAKRAFDGLDSAFVSVFGN